MTSHMVAELTNAVSAKRLMLKINHSFTKVNMGRRK